MIKQYDSETAFWDDVKVGDILQLSGEGEDERFVQGVISGERVNSFHRKWLLDAGIQVEAAAYFAGEWHSNFKKLEKLKDGKVIALYPTPKKRYIVNLRSGYVKLDAVTEGAAIERVGDIITESLKKAGLNPTRIVLTAEEV